MAQSRGKTTEMPTYQKVFDQNKRLEIFTYIMVFGSNCTDKQMGGWEDHNINIEKYQI